MEFNSAIRRTLAAFAISAFAVAAHAATAVTASDKPDIVLVHGAFADGSSWNKVIPLLKAKGFHVVAVQNPLSSLADDVAAANRVINQQKHDVVLVGHSWGGYVISDAGNSPKVKSLVYVAAFAPPDGASINDLSKGQPAPPYADSLVNDEKGFMTLTDDGVAKHFAQDVSPAEQQLIAATQGPWNKVCLSGSVAHPAWHDKPSVYVLAEKDGMIDPKLQTKMSADIKATVIKVSSSHVPMISHPQEVANAIVRAAANAK